MRSILLILALAIMMIPVVAQEEACTLDDAELLADEAAFYLEIEDYESSLREINCALKLDPDNALYLNYRGVAYHYLREYVLALADYDRALELDPELGIAYSNRGIIYYLAGGYEEAIKEFNRSIQLQPEQLYSPYYNRGFAQYEQGSYDLALADLTRAIELEPSFENSYLVRGSINQALGDDQAHSDFAHWIALIETDRDFMMFDGSVEGDPFTLSEGRVYHLMFDGDAGQVISAEARAAIDAEVDPLLVLLDPNGTPLISDDDSGVNLDAVIADYVLSQDGIHTLLLSHGGGGTEGEVTLALNLSGVSAAAFRVYRLFVDETAEVYLTGQNRLNLRAGPGLDFEIIGRLELFTRVTLVEGPHKADGFAWWHIRSGDDLDGWVVERDEVEQTLQLALLVGKEAIVTTGGDLLNVRVEPRVSADLVFQIEDEVSVTLLDGPVIADNHRWWRLRSADGDEGWAIDRFEGARMLIPARERE